MKLARLLLPTFAGLALALAWVLGLAQAAPAAVTRYVAPGGADSGACSDSVAPCATIQYAVDQAADGDDIHVAAGTYTGVTTRPAPAGYQGPATITQTLYITKEITVRGGYSADFAVWDPAANLTTLDPQGAGRALFIAGSGAPAVEGLRLVNGSADGLGGHPLSGDAGGGGYVLSATATLDQLTVMSNTALASQGRGAGLFLMQCDCLVSQSTIQGNSADFQGGGLGLWQSDATISSNLILNNSANVGGGLHAYQGSFVLQANTFQDNTGVSGGAGLTIDNTNSLDIQPRLISNKILNNSSGFSFSFGGGLYLYFSDPLMERNLFEGNAAGTGGAAFFYMSEPSSTNDVFRANEATQAGPGVYLNGSQVNFLHTTLSVNTGAEASGLLLKENTDFGTPIHSTAALTNAIVMGHSAGITVSLGNTATVNGVLWFANALDTAGAGVSVVSNDLTGDPKFEADGYHLTASSPAIDQGIDSGVTTDIDDYLRPYGLGYDLGADEYAQLVVFLPFIVR